MLSMLTEFAEIFDTGKLSIILSLSNKMENSRAIADPLTHFQPDQLQE